MKKLKILSIEKHKDLSFKALEAEFLKRTKRFASIEFVSMKRPKYTDQMTPEDCLEADAASILKQITPQDFFVVLTPEGKQMTSEQFSSVLQRWYDVESSITFLIGGPWGVATKVKERADFLFSLSSLTFTHEMARMLLCEVLYRSFDIANNGNYHK